MTQWAYVPYFEGWEDLLPNANLCEVDNERIELNSATLTPEEVKYVRKRHRDGKGTPTCAYCHSPMKYDPGFTRPDGLRRAPSFKHHNRQACFHYDSLQHAATKQFVFSRLESAGYRVYEDTRPLNGQKLHADVAAYQQEDKLRLVVEVLATPPRMDTMVRKINTFASEQVPTAWVLLLDDFFAQGVSGGVTYLPDMSKAGEITYTPIPVEAGTEVPFIVIGVENRIFSFLIDQYGYAIGIYQPGFVFLIRRDRFNEQQRQLQLLRGQSWEFGDDLFMITRIADKDVVPTLLHTPLLQFQQELGETTPKLPPGIPKDLQASDHPLLSDDELPEAATIIDFEAHKLDGEEAELAFDPLQLIQQSRQARITALQMYEEEKSAERAQEAAREAQEHEELLREEQRQTMARQAVQAAQETEEAERALQLQQRTEQLKAQEKAAASIPNQSAEEPWPWRSTRHRMQAEQRELLYKEIMRRGYDIVHQHELDFGSEAEGLLVIKALRDHRAEDSPIQLHQDQRTITNAFAQLDEPGRTALERYLYPDGISSDFWFLTMMTQQRQKEQRERKKQESIKRREIKQEQVREQQKDQIRFDF